VIHEYRGVIHVHSTFSDGRAGIDKIMSEANRAEVDFLILTDHNGIEAKLRGYEGWYDHCLLLVGEEITPNTNADHYLALDISTAISPSDEPQANINAVRRQRGIGIIAHPTGGAIVQGEYFEYPWTDWDAGRFEGIEVWNHAYDITGRPKNIFQLIFNILFPRAAISGPIQSVLDTWDLYSLKQSRRILGVGGVDAHGWPGSYRADFGTVCTYILTEEPFSNDAVRDGALVYDALRAGRCFVGADKVAKASGFRCEVACGEDTLQMGGRERLSDGACLQVCTPSPGLIRLIHNGDAILEGIGAELEAMLNCPGVYRVEVKRRVCGRYVPWIYGNHFFLA
jgi:hypothetical protein